MPFFVFQGIAGGVPRQCTDYMAEVLFALNNRDVSLLSLWLQVIAMVTRNVIFLEKIFAMIITITIPSIVIITYYHI